MAISKAFIIIIALFLLSLLNTNNAAAPVGSPTGPSIDCGAACTARCQLSSRPNLCHRACGTCCARCNCVPPGTSGNLDTCPCYANMKTHGNRRKCP
ncbi:snakin-2-like isoform X2 [Malania oleifera]|uniref:snakin-2-like isoform X2 n=1 Tax=Malania oleifera TaxID=397392 RepID=UPI0025AE4E61|nr:snakin-2-like isoform X2 [Malania oleifera]